MTTGSDRFGTPTWGEPERRNQPSRPTADRPEPAADLAAGVLRLIARRRAYARE